MTAGEDTATSRAAPADQLAQRLHLGDRHELKLNRKEHESRERRVEVGDLPRCGVVCGGKSDRLLTSERARRRERAEENLSLSRGAYLSFSRLRELDEAVEVRVIDVRVHAE